MSFKIRGAVLYFIAYFRLHESLLVFDISLNLSYFLVLQVALARQSNFDFFMGGQVENTRQWCAIIKK